MAISHELSSEIATALFALRENDNRSPHELHELKEMLLQIHAALEKLQRHGKGSASLEQIDEPTLSKAVGQQN